MRESRAIMADLASSGMTPEQIALVMELAAAVSSEARPAVDEAAQRRRDRDREYQAEKRAKRRQTSADSADNTLDKENPPTPPKEIKPKTPPISPPFAEKFVAAWNDAAKRTGLTKAISLNDQRKAKLKRRVAEFGEDAMLEAITKLAASPFHCGENDRGWTADIAWLLKSNENVTKALELTGTAKRAAANDPGGFLAHVIERQRREQQSAGP